MQSALKKLLKSYTKKSPIHQRVLLIFHNGVKKEQCWDNIKTLNIEVNLEGLLIENEEQQTIKKEAKKIKQIDSGIEMQAFILELPTKNKNKLLEYYQKDVEVSPMKLDILRKYCSGSLLLPSEKQAKILYELHNQALDEELVL